MLCPSALSLSPHPTETSTRSSLAFWNHNMQRSPLSRAPCVACWPCWSCEQQLTWELPQTFSPGLPLNSLILLYCSTSTALSLKLHIPLQAFPAPPIASATPSTMTFKFMFPEKNYFWISESHFQLLISHFHWWRLNINICGAGLILFTLLPPMSL